MAFVHAQFGRENEFWDGIPASGREADGTPLYIANAMHAGGIIPGKFRADWTSIVVSWAGEEVWVPTYHLWTGNVEGGKAQWLHCHPGTKPALARLPAACGKEHDGTLLFAARARVDGGLQIGRWRRDWGAAAIPYGGKEIWVNQFEVLCSNAVLIDNGTELHPVEE